MVSKGPAKKSQKAKKPARDGALVVVESPAKCRTIEKILGKKHQVLASMGHIMDLPKSRMGIDIENVPFDDYGPYDYDDSPEQFKKDINDIVTLLRKYEL